MNTAQRTFIACVAALFFALTGAIVDLRDLGAEISPALLATFKAGAVTSVGSTSIGIGGVEYRVKVDAEILDHKGNEIKLLEVFPRSEARFHLNKDNEIDMMVIKRPQ